MKHLYIVRHGKAATNSSDIADYDRGLKDVGIFNVYNMAERLKSQGLELDLMISSTAIRAYHTASIMANVLDYALDCINVQSFLYLANTLEIKKFLNNINIAHNHVMLVGHNPTLSDLASEYTYDQIMMPTSGIVHLTFDCKHWIELDNSTLAHVEFLHP